MKVSLPTSFEAHVTGVNGKPQVVQRKILADIYTFAQRGGFKIQSVWRNFANGDCEKI